MTYSIFLFAGPTNCTLELLLGLAMSLIPALLGLLAARSFFKVDDLRENNTRLTADNGEMSKKVNTLTSDNTDLRVKMSQLEADLETKTAQLSKQRNDLIIAESERNIFKTKLEECEAKNIAVTPAVAAASVAAVTPPAPPPPPAPAAKAGPVSFLFNGTKYRADDLKIVEGIGPKIEELLHNDGIKTWLALGEASYERLKKILDNAGPRFAMHNPTTWPRQSMLAHKGDWDGLKKMQDELTAGRE
jgi:predicted flap endonuclease-1-like 5' DNA nuclease